MRKLIEFDEATFSALKILAADRMATLQELAEEAFADLLRKYGRPTDLKEALVKSLRKIPANDHGKVRPHKKPLRTAL